MNTDHHSIQLIETDNEVAAMAAILATKKLISFDTEFDRFWRGYGFKMYLFWKHMLGNRRISYS